MTTRYIFEYQKLRLPKVAPILDRLSQGALIQTKKNNPGVLSAEVEMPLRPVNASAWRRGTSAAVPTTQHPGQQVAPNEDFVLESSFP